jgi:hypothetical protein
MGDGIAVYSVRTLFNQLAVQNVAVVLPFRLTFSKMMIGSDLFPKDGEFAERVALQQDQLQLMRVQGQLSILTSLGHFVTPHLVRVGYLVRAGNKRADIWHAVLGATCGAGMQPARRRCLAGGLRVESAGASSCCFCFARRRAHTLTVISLKGLRIGNKGK